MINKTIYQVDAFTDAPFKGNPAGVILVDDSMTSERMQLIAMEMNLSETAFLTEHEEGFLIRYFTPTKEVPLCGHATLASAHIVYMLGLKSTNEIIRFKAAGGDLIVHKEQGWIVMNFPSYPLQSIPNPGNFKSLVGFEPIECYSSSYGWIIALGKNIDDIRNATPHFELIKEQGLGHLMITAKSTGSESDFVVRCFAPESGINEDPVTGSAHCALTPMWSKKLGKTEMTSIQLSDRSGFLKLKMLNNRVEIQGQAVTIFEATLNV